MFLVYPGPDLGQMDLIAFSAFMPVFYPLVDFPDEVLGDGFTEWESDFFDAIVLGVADFSGEVFVFGCGVIARVGSFFGDAGQCAPLEFLPKIFLYFWADDHP
jgi:hypothetical protein